jgi:hypothetical protein
VLCVVFYGAYRFITVIPWGGYDPGFDPVERALVGVIITALGVVQVRFAFRPPVPFPRRFLLAVQVLLSYGPFLVFGTRWDPPAAFVVASVLLTFTGRFSWAMAALAVVCDVAIGIALEPGTVDDPGDIVAMRVAYSAVVAIANGSLLFGMSRLSALVRDLDATRAASARWRWRASGCASPVIYRVRSAGGWRPSSRRSGEPTARPASSPSRPERWPPRPGRRWRRSGPSRTTTATARWPAR